MKIEQQGFRFVQSITTVLFEEIENIRNSADKLDKTLSDYFQTPGTSIAIGPGVDPTIPRLQYPSKFGHSILNISNVTAQMTTNIDKAWEKDFEKISSYCSEREESLEKVLTDVGAVIKWVGWSIKIQKTIGKPDHEDFSASLLIKNHFYKEDALLGHQKKLYEIMQRVAFLEKDRFYFNFNVSNFKAYTLQFEAKPGQKYRIVNPALRDLKFEEQGVEFSLEANSKYAYDFGSEQGHQKDDFINSIELVKNFIATRLESKEWI